MTRRKAIWVVLAVGLIGLFAASLALGSVNIPLGEIIIILQGGEPERESWRTIVIQFRLVKAITAAMAGAALGVSGLVMQTLFRNPLADPYVLGISSGASLGVALVILAAGSTGLTLLSGLGLFGDFALIAAAVAGAAAVLIIVMIAARRVASTMTLLILGLMFGYATSAFVSLLIHFSIAERVQAYVNWTFGSFGGVTWSQIPFLTAAVLIGLAAAAFSSKSLNALLLGDAYACSMGLNIRGVRMALIACAAILAGAVTAFCGPIGFLGIAVPHLCRELLQTSDHRRLLPATVLLGAGLALLADIIAQTPGTTTVLPLNAITALFGAPIVVSVILRRRTTQAAFRS